MDNEIDKTHVIFKQKKIKSTNYLNSTINQETMFSTLGSVGFSSIFNSALLWFLDTVLYMVPGYSALYCIWLQCSTWFLDTVLYMVPGYSALYGSWIQCSILYLATVLYMGPGYSALYCIWLLCSTWYLEKDDPCQFWRV